MPKHRCLTEEEAEIVRRNGIDEKEVCVSFRTEDAIYLLNHNTRDTIVIHQGDKKW